MIEIMFLHNIYPTFSCKFNYQHEIGYFNTSKYGTPSKIDLGIRCHI